jgi:predicted nucleic acid-binding protein
MSAGSKPRVFFDSNIVIYCVALGDPRSEAAQRLLFAGGHVSVQVLNEVVNVSRRKLGKSWAEIEAILDALRLICEQVWPVTEEAHRLALVVALRYGLQIYDAMIVASATLGGCDTLYSEDMQDGQRIGGFTIRNPFISPA